MICDMDCPNCIHDDCIKGDAVKEWRLNNPEKVKAIRKRQYEKNKDSEKKYSKDYYEKHKNDAEFIKKQRENTRKWKEANRERTNAQEREARKKKKMAVG